MEAFAYKYISLATSIANGVVPVGSNIVAYVRSTGQNSSDSSAITSKFYTSLTTALAACTSGRRDIIIVLPGHNEAVGTTMFTSAPTDVRIIGVGGVDEDLAPTFKWSGASSNWAIAAKNTMIAGIRMIADADNITEMVTVTAAGVKFVNCWVDAGVSSSLDGLIVFNPSTGANQFSVIGCDMRGTAATGITQFIKCATVVDETKIMGNKIVAAGSSTTVGLIDISAAVTNIYISDNVVEQQKAAGTVAISLANVASTGVIRDNYLGTLANAVSPAAAGIIFTSTGSLVHCYQNFACDGLGQVSGILAPVVTS